MKRVLVAIPHKANLHPVLFSQALVLSNRLANANPDYEVDVAMMANDITVSKSCDPFTAHAMARNMLLDKHLNGHDLVMWIDADLVDYPADIITQLDRANPGGVTAPIVLIEGTTQFYDTYGYRQCGEPISHIPPYFNPFKALVNLDEVGCAYLIPASVYDGPRYDVCQGHTEHFSIMWAARQAGLKVACYTGMTIYHADLPKYGEQWHGH